MTYSVRVQYDVSRYSIKSTRMPAVGFYNIYQDQAFYVKVSYLTSFLLLIVTNCTYVLPKQFSLQYLFCVSCFPGQYPYLFIQKLASLRLLDFMFKQLFMFCPVPFKWIVSIKFDYWSIFVVYGCMKRFWIVICVFKQQPWKIMDCER